MADNHTETYQGQCTVCYGRGYTWVEDDQGRPTSKVTCPYCKGSKRSTWAVENLDGYDRQQAAKLRRRRLRAALVISVTTLWWIVAPHDATNANSTLSGAHCFVTLFAVYYAWVLWHYRPMSKRRLARRRFTSQSEANLIRIAGAATSAGVWWKQTHRHR